ncbi:MAG TPA: heterodisulfide reductase-related iron-sulfur binding cluster, partial [Negativicutes bacterium]|nr:heterodisulfide reductase-related iron-sulfur binding cluster [Negativicutes bacterium]
MDRMLSRERENQCIQEQQPACTAACPIHVNARGMIAATSKQDFADGFAIFTRTAPFPRIISRICDEPCRTVCKRNEVGEGIEVRALEQACVEYCDKAPKKAFLPPKKSTRLAVVGGSLAGLTVAFDLAQKGYPVVIYEAGERLGGRIWRYDAQQLPRNWIENDFSALREMGVEVHFGAAILDKGAITCDQLLADYDAVYIGMPLQNCTGRQLQADPETYATDQEKLFGGVVDAEAPIDLVLQGRVAAISIDRFLQNASMSAGRDQLGFHETLLYTDVEKVKPLAAIPLTDRDQGYSRENAVMEAQRCLQCQCLECVKKCEYLSHYGGYPKKYIREIYNNDSIVMGIHYANKMINSCALCGLCRAVCPNELNMGDVCQEARQRMVEKGKMPLSVHDFALRDMEFSSSEQCTLSRHQPGFDHSNYLFFPGCQLSASAPNHVLKTYAFLREKLSGGVGILLNCCGIPAEWAGRQELFAQTLATVEAEWRRMGSPTVIVACSSCYRVFKEHWPLMAIESLWSVMDRSGLPESTGIKTGRTVCVHDPCAARTEQTVQDSVRNLLGKMGLQIDETESSREQTTCCGYGGLMSFANPEVAQKVVHRRIGESPADYVAYCAMCRDNFVAGGKNTFHLLDLIWDSDENAATRPAPDYSSRRENRIRVKKQLLREVWNETVAEEIGLMKIEFSETI